MVANPAYLFTTKRRVTRLASVEGSTDVDIRRLARKRGLSAAREALDLEAAVHVDRVIEHGTMFGREEIFDRLTEDDDPPNNGPRFMPLSSQWPTTRHENALRASNSEQVFDPALREFLDHFSANPADHKASRRAQPIPLDDLCDACLATASEHPVRV